MIAQHKLQASEVQSRCREGGVLDHLDLLDERHVTVVEEAIAEDRIGFAIQGIHAVDDPSQILYDECLARRTEQNGTGHHPDSAFVPALDALGEAPTLDRHILKRVLGELESDPLAVLGCNLSADNLSDPANWTHIHEQIAARSEFGFASCPQNHCNAALRRYRLGG
jgi:EAL domain-containing protein (putative c-di-GMP-specific phosphodiesterase class I)